MPERMLTSVAMEQQTADARMRSRMRRAARVLGGVSAAIGIVVLIGWAMKSTLLMQLHPSLAIMQVNTALGFVVCGLALVCLAFDGRRLAFVLSLVGAGIGSATLYQYLTGTDLGIDELFVKAYSGDQAPFPGRMATGTATSFLFSSLVILLWCFPRASKRFYLLGVFLAAVVFSFAGSTMLAYLVGIRRDEPGWEIISEMAFHTRANFLLLSAGLLSFAWARCPRILGGAPNWSYWTVGIAAVMASLVMWQAQVVEQNQVIRLVVKKQFMQVVGRLQQRVDTKGDALHRMAERFAAIHDTSLATWHRDVDYLFEDFASIRSIELLDGDLQQRWIKSRPDLQAYPDDSEARRTAYERARQHNETVVAIDDGHSGIGSTLLICVPVQDQGRFAGLLVGVIKIAGLFEELLGLDYNAQYINELRLPDDTSVYRSAAVEEPRGRTYAYREQFRLGTQPLVLIVTPRPPLFQQLVTFPPWVFLVEGGLMAYFLALLVRIALHGRAREVLLTKTSEQLDLAVSGSSDGLWDWDIRTDRVWYSMHFKDMLGYTQEDFPDVFESFQSHLHEDDIPHVQEAVKAHFERNETYDVEFRMRTKSGAYRWFRARGRAVRDANGKPVRMAGSNQDITERKAVEFELQRSLRDLEQFAFIASHDLQEPLRMVSSYTQLLAKRYEGQLDEQADKFIGFATDGVNRMKQLINDLLNFSRVGYANVELQLIDAELALNHALQNAELLIKENAARITHDRLPMLQAEEIQFQQLLQNLIVNAIRYRRDVSPRIHISARRYVRGWLFAVQDNGVGIEPQYLERIFAAFQRLDRSRSGSGIGLAICRKIVETRGGRIWVDSQYGQGSTFCFTVPDQKEEINDDHPEWTADRDLVGGRQSG